MSLNVLGFVCILCVKRLITQCNAGSMGMNAALWPAVLRKAVFYKLKDGLLSFKTWPFGTQKAAYWKSVGGGPPFHFTALHSFQAFSP